MNEYSDSELLEIFRNENTSNYAFNLLVRKYQQKIYWQVRRMVIDHDDANDVTQNTFVKVWKGLNSFREDSRLSTWIYRIAANEALSFLQQKRKRFFLPLHDVEHELSDKLADDSFFSGEEIQKKLQKAILALPEKQRIVFNLRYYDEMPYDEMSEVLKTSAGALKASFHHAVKKIEDYFNNNR